MEESASGWDGILDPGETVLWQGPPDGKVVVTGRSIFMLFFGLSFAGFALFWMIIASQAGGGFWMFGLIHFSVGLGICFAATYWPAYRRRNSWYTLTNTRAMIASDLPVLGKKLDSYPITADTVLEFRDEALATINFATRRKRSNNGYRTVPIGFERIENGREVYRLMRDVQRDAHSSGNA